MKNLVSIIIPTFNRLDKLVNAIESVRKQNYKNYEIIVVDNCSTDGTIEYLNRLNDNKISIFKIKNYGNIAKSRNLGILNSKGDMLAFLDSDDLWYPNKLSLCVDEMNKKNLDFLYHNMKMKKDNSLFKKKIGYFRELKKKNVYNQLIYTGPAFPTSSVILRKKIFNEINKFDENYKKITWEDFDAWIRFSKKTNNFGCLNKILGEINIGADNYLSKNNQIKNILTFKEIYLQNAQSLPTWCLVRLLTLFFKLNNYEKFYKFYNHIDLKKITLKNSIKIRLLSLLLRFQHILRKFSF